jgi:hypothetical protein
LISLELLDLGATALNCWWPAEIAVLFPFVTEVSDVPVPGRALNLLFCLSSRGAHPFQ